MITPCYPDQRHICHAKKVPHMVTMLLAAFAALTLAAAANAWLDDHTQ